MRSIIGSYERYWFDQESGILQFITDDQVLLEFKFIVIGTFAHTNETWMWGWKNSSLLPCIREASDLFRDLKEITGLEEFEAEGFNCDEQMAYEIVAMCVSHIDAKGMYKIPGERSHMFLALMDYNKRRSR